MSAPLLMPPWRWRRVTAGERAVLDEVFAGTLDAARLRVWCLPPIGWTFGRAFTPGGWVAPGRTVVAFPPKQALLDFTAAAAPLSALATFVHEATHGWQSQQGVNLAWAKLKAGDSPDSYRYALAPDTRWSGLNIEQQAMVVEHDFLARRGVAAPSDPTLYDAVIPWRKCAAGHGPPAA